MLMLIVILLLMLMPIVVLILILFQVQIQIQLQLKLKFNKIKFTIDRNEYHNLQLARHNLNYKWKHYLQRLLLAQDIGASDIIVAIGTEAKHIGAIDTEAKHTHIAEATVTNGALDITSLVIAASHVPAVDPRRGNNNFGWEEGGAEEEACCCDEEARWCVQRPDPQEEA